MKKVLFLLALLAFPAQAKAQDYSPCAHYIAGNLVSTASLVGAGKEAKQTGRIMAFGLSASLMIFKESMDKAEGGKWDRKDFLFGCFGALTPIALSYSF